MSATVLAVALSLVSAVAYAAAAVAQERLASRTADGAGPLRMLASSAWWWSVLLNAGAALLHVVSLKYGPLTLVQPLGALTLVAAVPMGARVAGRRVGPAEWRGTALTLLGLSAILVTASGPAPHRVLSLTEAVAVAGATAAVIGMLSWPGGRPGLRHATASGFASGVASALTQTVTVAATDRTGPALSAQVVVVALLVAAFAAGGLLLSQTAYRGGLGAPLAVVTLANPVAAAVIGLALLGQGLRGGVEGVLLALAGAACAAWGVLELSRNTPEPAAGSGGAPSPAGSPAGAAAAGSLAGAAMPTGAATAIGTASLAGTASPAGAVGAAGEDDGEHPVAAVLALEPGTATPEPALLPKQPRQRRRRYRSGRGHLTSL
ncbi:membrane protein [Streptomyces mangrovisoli]|uniref:Integral membrane protein n=1 Tax=Streptomyces mangrovisoli TaxID=1428628 RepID=A0A1J4NYP1_9ACTN|nr:membrane protein [Streptomyces mangrovisoli]OIJ66349.1 hypothetical protein WN71_018705 [Streptomyces mangrovisoli]